MLRIIVGAVALGLGAYALNEARSENRDAIEDYEDEFKSSKSTIKSHYNRAERKDKLDKLFKAKRAKQKISNTIYKKLKEEKKNLYQIQQNIISLKERLNQLFEQKRLENKRDKKIEIQKKINIVLLSRKELFKTQDSFKKNLAYFRMELNNTNRIVKDIQQEINYLSKN